MKVLFIALIKRDMLIIARSPSQWLTPLGFFLLVVAIFPLAIGTKAELLRLIAPGVIWSIALLSSLLSQHVLFRQDAEDGCLEQLLLLPYPLVIVTFAKTIVHWLSYGAPLILLAPLLGAWMQMTPSQLQTLLITLPLGTGIFSLLAAFSAALLAGVRHGQFISALIALPLCLPAIIFAAAAVFSTTSAPLLLLVALFTFSLTILPIVTAGALALSAEIESN